MKKLLIFGLLSMLLVVFASRCVDVEIRIHEKEVVKIQKNINTALTNNDFVTAHQYLGELLLLRYEYIDLERRQEASVRDVYLAEMRYLVSVNDALSWNRANMLPMEVPKGFERTRKELYKALYDYAVMFDNEEIKEKAGKTLNYLEGDRMIMPVSTTLSGPMGEFFEVVGKEEGYKMILDEETDAWSWKLTVEIERIKDGKVLKGGNRNDHHTIIVNLLDEDNTVIDSYSLEGWGGGDGVKVGETKFITFSNRYDLNGEYEKEKNLTVLDRVKSVSKFEVTSEK